METEVIDELEPEDELDDDGALRLDDAEEALLWLDHEDADEKVTLLRLLVESVLDDPIELMLDELMELALDELGELSLDELNELNELALDEL